MTGERRLWYRLASHLGKTLQEVQDGTTSSEFAEWVQFLEEEMNVLTRTDYYLAQIAAEVRRVVVRNPKSVKIEDMILKFQIRGEGKERVPPEEVLRKSKAFWLGSLGIRY